MIEKLSDKHIYGYTVIQQLFDKINEIIDYINKQEPVEEWPQMGFDYWYIRYNGEVDSCVWAGTLGDKESRKFLGIFRTEQEAEARRDSIKKFISTLN